MTVTIRFNPGRALAMALLLVTAALPLPCPAQDLADVRKAGVLRHLGIPYAHFVTGAGDGLDVDIMRRFARHLGVHYEYVASDWKRVFGDLTGRAIRQQGTDFEITGEIPIRGDLIANGLTILPWRQKLIDYSAPTFPSGVWLIARAESPLKPIRASGERARDVGATKSRLRGSSVLVMESTCLDPRLYDLTGKGLSLRYYTRSTNLNEMVPAILNGDADSTLLDVPDALIALEKWPGQIKVIGPISDDQLMGVGFRKSSPELRAEFNRFFEGLKRDGSYLALVRQYYPSALRHFPEFFGLRQSGLQQVNTRAN